MQQASIKSFFQSKASDVRDLAPAELPEKRSDGAENRSACSSPKEIMKVEEINSAPTPLPEKRSPRKEKRSASSSSEQKTEVDKVVIVLSDTEPEERNVIPTGQKKRRLVVPGDRLDCKTSSKQNHFVSAIANKVSNEMTTLSEKAIASYLLKHGSLLKDAIHSRSLKTLKEMLFGTLATPKKPNQLWTKKFETNRCVNQDVDDLMRSWMRIFIRRRPLDINDDEVALLEEHRIRSAAEQRRDNQFIVDDSDDDEIPLCRVLVLEGSIGSGKTSAVHSCLYALNEDKKGVIEVNASQRRRQADLVNRFKEATQSQWIDDRTSSLKPKKSSKKVTKGKNGRPSGPISDKHAVVLIDDVDIMLEEDAGFSKGIAFLLKDTKRPIILTCAELPNSIRSLLSNGYYNFALLEQNQETLVSFLLSILLSEGAVSLPSDVDLKRCLQLLHNDLRSTLNNLQFWLDVDRDSLISNIQKRETLQCLNAPSAYLYQRFSGFGNLPLESIWKFAEFQNLESVVRHGTESELCNVIHENYIKLCSDNDDDPRHIDSTADLANIAEALSITDLISAYRNPKQELPLHQRILCCTSELVCEYYRGFVCNSPRNIEISDCSLHSSCQEQDHCQFASIWEEYRCAEPAAKHHPSISFAIDHMSAIRLISRSEERSRESNRRVTRRSSVTRFVQYRFFTRCF